MAEEVIQGALRGGKGLNAEQRDVHDYARAVVLNEEMDPELLSRLRARVGEEALAETAFMPPLRKRARVAQGVLSTN